MSTVVRVKGRRRVQVWTRISPESMGLLEVRAAADGMRVSDVLRAALVAYLADPTPSVNAGSGPPVVGTSGGMTVVADPHTPYILPRGKPMGGIGGEPVSDGFDTA